MSQSPREVIRAKLAYLYGSDSGGACFALLAERLDAFRDRTTGLQSRETVGLSERDVVLITYGDMLRSPDESPLATLNRFLAEHLKDTISTIHVLPFFPYSSDDGFSVIDYRVVDPKLGTWDDIRDFRRNFNLMVDAVINHTSTQNEWFQGFLRSEERYQDYFITVDPNSDLSQVVRPRALPLLTPVQTVHGERHVWTTFSSDQIDLNYSNPEVLLAIIDVLLFYVEQGAGVIRLDAIAYLWKKIGTASINLPQTHVIVQLLRAIVEDVAPWVLLITETNVPHEENISYFGDGTNEAHLVYQFPLPPLVAHTFLTGNARRLTEWAAELKAPSSRTAFFNFTASHDGVGMRPATGILSEDEVQALLRQAKANGGRVSFKTNDDGSASPYELNITYFDLLNAPYANDPQELQVRRFLASQAIALALAGVPGIYIHSLLGSRNYSQGVARTGDFRSINRKKLNRSDVAAALEDAHSLRSEVFNGYKAMLHERIREKAFHPAGTQRAITLSDTVFSLLRIDPKGEEAIIALHNVSSTPQDVIVNTRDLGLDNVHAPRDIVSGRTYQSGTSGSLRLALEPYQVAWLKL